MLGPVPRRFVNGKIAYLEIPTTDIERSATFYRDVFGWRLRKRGDGVTAFDDPSGEVSGTWVTDRTASGGHGLLVYVLVDRVEAAVEAVVANGGEIVQPIGVDPPPAISARFRDPAGKHPGGVPKAGSRS